MDDESADREERKREYNRLAQREFRRRRKEHLKSLEQAQKERTSEQSGEIERLRHQNTELKRENEALKAQLYGLTGNSHMQIPPAPSSHPQHLCYPDSPSVSSTVDSISGAGSPPASLGSEMLPMSSLSLTSAGMPPSMQAYNDAMLLSYFPSQRYSMVTSSSNHDNAKSSPESSDFGSTQPTMGSSNSLQFMNTTQSPMPRSNPGPVRPNSFMMNPSHIVTSHGESSNYPAPSYQRHPPR